MKYIKNAYLIVGTQNNSPQTINIVANSIGPIVKVGVSELDFGSVDVNMINIIKVIVFMFLLNILKVLREYTKTIIIRNESKIEADFHAFTKNKVSVFRPL